MKMLKKLMAAALVCVMALTVLTGCGANNGTLVQMMNDYANRSGYGWTVSEDAGLTKNAKTIAEKAGKLSNVSTAAKEVLGEGCDDKYIVTTAVDNNGAKNDFVNKYLTMNEAFNLANGVNNNLSDHAGKTVKKVGFATMHDATTNRDYMLVVAQLENK